MVIKPSGRDACINFLNRVIQKYEDKGIDSMEIPMLIWWLAPVLPKEKQNLNGNGLIQEHMQVIVELVLIIPVGTG